MIWRRCRQEYRYKRPQQEIWLWIHALLALHSPTSVSSSGYPSEIVKLMSGNQQVTSPFARRYQFMCVRKQMPSIPTSFLGENHCCNIPRIFSSSNGPHLQGPCHFRLPLMRGNCYNQNKKQFWRHPMRRMRQTTIPRDLLANIDWPWSSFDLHT